MLKFLIWLLLLVPIFSILYFFFPVITICGYSMYPTLNDGEIFIGRRVFRKTKCKVGEIYVYKAPDYEGKGKEVKYVIKRLASIKEGKYYFLGDNLSDSQDSRMYGLVDSRRVVAHLKRGERNGL